MSVKVMKLEAHHGRYCKCKSWLSESAQALYQSGGAHLQHAQPGSRAVARLFTSLVMNEPTFYAAFTFRRFLISLKPTERHRLTARSPLSNLPRTDRPGTGGSVTKRPSGNAPDRCYVTWRHIDMVWQRDQRFPRRKLNCRRNASY